MTGNHEYYTRRPRNEEDNRSRAWLEERHPHVELLLDEEVSIGGVNFFGGTMWIDRFCRASFGYDAGRGSGGATAPQD